MRLNTLAFAGLAAVVAAQSPAQTSAVESAISSYFEAEATDPALMSLAAVYATNTEAASKFASAFQSLANGVYASGTLPANFLSALPTDVQPVIASVISVEASIYSANGFTSEAAALAGVTATGASNASPTGSNGVSSTKTGTNAASAPTAAMGLAAAAGAGFLGIVMAL